jgi:hypothetical protein
MTGLVYQVQFTTNLLSPTWNDLADAAVATSSNFMSTLIDTNAISAPLRFYRLRVALPTAD